VAVFLLFLFSDWFSSFQTLSSFANQTKQTINTIKIQIFIFFYILHLEDMSESGDGIIIEDPELGEMEVVEEVTVEDDQKSDVSDRGNPNESQIMVI